MRNKWSRLLALLMTVTIVFNTFSGTAFATESGETGTVVSSESETTASETESETEVETETEAETETSTEEDTEGSTEVSTEESSEGATEESTDGVTEEETTEDAAETTTEESSADETEASGEDATEASTEESAEESSADMTEESTGTSAEENSAAETEETIGTSAEESSADATEESSTEAEEESSEGATQESTEEGSEATPEESTAESTTQVGDIAASETLGAAGGVALLTGAVVGATETYATSDTIYVLAGSDFQPTDGSNTTGVNLLNQILDKVDDKYTTMDGFLFAGDYDYNYANSTAGKNALQAAVQAVYGTGMDEVYVEGNHDNPDEGDNPDMVANGTLSPSGANDTDNYGVYVIHESDYMWRNDDETTIKNTASSLEAYLNAKRNAGYTKPIFVVSHLPLHYCMRTQVGGGDGKHANYIFDVLNEAGAAGLNIIFMFGHNHSHGWDDPYGGAAIFLKKGDSINIAQNSTTDYDVETLNFTYMNAGYVSYYRNVNSGAETDLSMTVFAITDSDVTIERYTADGLHDLKSAGVANTHASTGSSVDGSCSTNHGGTETYSPDTSTVASAYTLTLSTEVTPAGEEVEAPDSGSTSTQRTYTRVTSLDDLVSGGQYLIIENGGTDYFMLPESISNDAGDRVGYNIESTSVAGGDTIIGDYSAKEWTMTGSGTSWVLSTSAGRAYMEYQSSSRAYGRISSSNSSTFTIGGSADAYTFSTTTNGYTYVFDHSSAGMINGYVKTPETTFYIYRLTDEGSAPTVDTTGGSWITITEPTEAGARYVYELDTDGVDTGVEYLIVANSYEKALSAAASSNNAVDIEISGNYAYADSDTYGWTFTRYSSGVYYIRLNGSTYLRLNNGNLASSNSTGSDRRWTVGNNGDGSYDVTGSVTSGNFGDQTTTTYNLRWSNSNGVFQSSSSNEGPVRLYKYVRTETTTAQPGLYGMISGELTYNVAIGTSAADALAAVKAGIDIFYHYGDESAAATFPDDGDGMTWTLDSSYDGTTPGEYAVTIAYNGVTLGVAKVVVPSVNIKSYSIDPMSSTVRQGASQTLNTGSVITVTLENDNYYTVPVTISMLSKDGEAVSTAEAGTLTGLTVTYNGVVVTNDYTLNVIEKIVNNYPEYPDEGAVKVNKTATGIDFQSSGIAQVELSASGVPAQKGADVVIVIDTSSSMDDDIDGETPSSGEKSRIEILSESLEQMLLQFQQQDDSGVYPDIDIAIIDFNGYLVEKKETDFDTINLDSDYGYRTAQDLSEVYTGTNTGFINDVATDTGLGIVATEGVGLSADNFVDVTTINAAIMAGQFTTKKTYSGTNYDSGLDNAYKLLELKKEANGNEERDQYVIFLSDGAPFRYNGFNHNNAYYGEWTKWLSGTWEDENELKEDYPNASYTYFYNGNGTSHPHRIAEAIKGTPGVYYDVVDRSAENADTAYFNKYAGLGAKVYSIGFGLAADGSSSQGYVTVAAMQNVLRAISSGDGFYYDVDSADELTTAFTQIATAINYAASNARFVDQMGDDFNLQLKTSTYTVVENGAEVEKTLAPVIEVLTYDIYTRQDYLDGTITEDKIGDRKGTYTLNEVIKFSEDGTKAYSNLIDVDGDGTYGVTVNSDGTYTISDTDDNIIDANGVIYATTFLYNTGVTDVAIDGVNIPTGVKNDGTTTGSTNVLPSETFYWKMDTITTTELAMRYYVYLDGSMEGTKNAGSYATNEYAILYYDNYLGNSCEKGTTSPTIAWKSANVSYAFYLVNENGEIIVNQTTGQTGSFANKIAITNPVVYKEILLNNIDNVEALSVAALGDNVLPTYYTLYDRAAVYTVNIQSNGAGDWTITSGKEVNSTYVTQYKTDDSSAYTNQLINENVGDDYTHTVVWFAVVWSLEAHPDTVVIDYGLPVDISVLSNDMFGDYGKLAGIGAYVDGLEDTIAGATMQTGFSTTYTGAYGTATADTTTGKVRYTPSNMQMNGYDKFAYAVNYTGSTNPGYYYDTITVIPATTVYYEDGFLTYTATNTTWSDEGTAIEGATQDEDRPGKYSLTDANNIYGYDSVNLGMSLYSLGTAKKVTVNANSSATAEFTFYGTGFDVISMTSSDTGILVVQVYKVDETGSETLEISKFVDTYYGYSYNGTEWVPLEDGVSGTPNEIYQVPVIQVDGLTYGKYRTVISAAYFDALNNVDDDSYDLYLDAIRIYDPANDGAADGTTDTVIEDAYKTDGEGWPEYLELRNELIEANTLGNATTDTVVTGLMFIDGDAEVGDAQISDYISYGPNNEVYLAPAQRIAFILDVPANVASVQLGIKSADGSVGTYTITNIAKETKTEGNVTAGTYYNAQTKTINTTTDMYYDITGWKGDIIVISNTGDRYGTAGTISLTNIKFTFTENPYGTTESGDEGTEEDTNAGISTASFLYMTPAAATLTLRAVNSAEVEEPETTTPEEETTVEETTAEETTVEETTAEESTETGTAAEETATEEATKEEITTEETTAKETTEEETTTEETTAKETIEEETTVEETTAEETIEEETTTEETTAEETTVEETAAEETTAEETTVEETTAEEITEEDTKVEDPSYEDKVEEIVPETFEPKKVTINLSSDAVKAGRTVLITVQTDSDVAALTINGNAVAKYIENRWTGTRTWIMSIKASEVGEMSVEVVAYSAKGVASEPIVETITVTANGQSMLDKIFGRLFR